MLSNRKIIALLPITDAEKAKVFYVGKLGLKFLQDDGFALVIDANGIMLRLTKLRELKPQPFTVLGWEIPDIEDTARQLQANGVAFERYHDFMKQDDLGIWTAPDGTKVAWFKDPDGNTLSLTQHKKVASNQ
jgi:catechol 2,3-dioxygenase-like lactoylglutathione lyase family enzyme